MDCTSGGPLAGKHQVRVGGTGMKSPALSQAPQPDATSHPPSSVSCGCGASCHSCQGAPLETTCAGSDSFLHQGSFRAASPIKKSRIEVDDGAFWIVSHPKDAARVICD